MNKRDLKHIYRSLLVVLVLEIILCGIEQFALHIDYSLIYALITVVFAAIQTVYCCSLRAFSDNKYGVKLFFLYKMVKAAIVLLPLIVYIFVASEADIWILIRSVAYYIVFLIVETVVYVKHQKSYSVKENNI